MTAQWSSAANASRRQDAYYPWHTTSTSQRLSDSGTGRDWEYRRSRTALPSSSRKRPAASPSRRTATSRSDFRPKNWKAASPTHSRKNDKRQGNTAFSPAIFPPSPKEIRKNTKAKNEPAQSGFCAKSHFFTIPEGENPQTTLVKTRIKCNFAYYKQDKNPQKTQ